MKCRGIEFKASFVMCIGFKVKELKSGSNFCLHNDCKKEMRSARLERISTLAHQHISTFNN